MMQNAVFSHADQNLLGPLNLSLPAKGVTAIMGANGAGKSLFLRLAHGILSGATGQINWGQDSAAASIQSRGFLFQDSPVMRRSVARNIAFPLQAAGIKDQKAKVAKALELARLTGQAQLPAAQLSGGQRQRMALARALVTEPEVLLLDEPSASLDPGSTRELETMVQDVASRGVKVLIATHDIAQARRLANDILFFDKGRLAEQADAHTFFASPASDAAQAYLEGRL